MYERNFNSTTNDSIKIIENIQSKFKEVSLGVEMWNKFKNFIEKNDGFQQ